MYEYVLLFGGMMKNTAIKFSTRFSQGDQGQLLLLNHAKFCGGVHLRLCADGIRRCSANVWVRVNFTLAMVLGSSNHGGPRRMFFMTAIDSRRIAAAESGFNLGCVDLDVIRIIRNFS